MMQPAGTSNANPLRTGTIVSRSDVRSASATSRMRAITSAEGMSGLSTLAMYAGLGKTTSYESHNVVFRPSIGDWQIESTRPRRLAACDRGYAAEQNVRSQLLAQGQSP